MKHGSEAYRIFRELLQERKAADWFLRGCEEYEKEEKRLNEIIQKLKDDNEALKARNLKLEQALERRTMENVLGTHRLVNREKDGTQYGEWASFIDGHSRSLEDALCRVVHQLLYHVNEFGMPDERG